MAMLIRTGPPASMRLAKGASRPLTEGERALLPPPLADAVKLGKVRIVARYHSPLARLFHVTIARGFRIFWGEAPMEAASLFERAHLAHELVHVWQYKGLRRTGLELLVSRNYRYRLQSGRPFLSYGYEQQAAIVEDFVRLKNGAIPRWAYGAIASIREYERTIATAPRLVRRTQEAPLTGALR
jgi:hypothetical protein